MLSCVFCLLAGLLVGAILPMPWDEDDAVPAVTNTLLQTPAGSGSAEGNVPAEAPSARLNSSDNFQLLNAACYVLQALKEADYAAVASVVHPEKGVTLTPYSTVDFESDRTLTRTEIKNLQEDDTVYTWGLTDGRGSLISMTTAQYFDVYVFDTDYTQAVQIGVDRVMISGNALENLTEAYPGCRFVDFSIPEQDPAMQGMDWSSLKLVFEPGEVSWYLVGIVHGQWTV